MNVAEPRQAPQERRARVVIAEDHPIVRDGLIELLKVESGVELVGWAEDAHGVRELVRAASAQLLLLDLCLGRDDGLKLAEWLLQERPGLKIVVLSAQREASIADRLLAMGVLAYIEKDRSCEELLMALRSALRGEVYMTAEQRERARLHGRAPGSDPQKLLSPRELSVLRLLASGKSSIAIATELSIASKTVHSHRRNIGSKLGIRRGRELMRYAIHWARYS
jgi:two-component system nitrate/nitrite response regulator NarL